MNIGTGYMTNEANYYDMTKKFTIGIPDKVEFPGMISMAIMRGSELGARYVNSVFSKIYKDYIGCEIRFNFVINKVEAHLIFRPGSNNFPNAKYIAFTKIADPNKLKDQNIARRIGQIQYAMSNADAFILTAEGEEGIADYFFRNRAISGNNILKNIWSGKVATYTEQQGFGMSQVIQKRVINIDVEELLRREFDNADVNGKPYFYEVSMLHYIPQNQIMINGQNIDYYYSIRQLTGEQYEKFMRENNMLNRSTNITTAVL